MRINDNDDDVDGDATTAAAGDDDAIDVSEALHERRVSSALDARPGAARRVDDRRMAPIARERIGLFFFRNSLSLSLTLSLSLNGLNRQKKKQ